MICVSIGEMPFLNCLKIASKFPLIEARLDLLQLTPENIEALGLQCRQWIATCRPGNYSQRERTILLSAAIYARATYVDIEYEAEPEYRLELINLAKQRNCKVIISYHNFESTPDAKTLNHIIKQSNDMGADVVKLVVTAKSKSDCALIMSLYMQHENLIAFAMGSIGKITRIAAPFLGAAFTYVAAEETRQTAPGQLTASEMEIIVRTLA